MDSWSAPERIGRRYSHDQDFDLGVDRRAASGGPTGEFGPVLTEPAPLPPQNGVGSNDHKRLSPPGPDPGQRHPEKPISRAELRPGRRSLVDGALLVQGEVFEGELAVAAAKKGQEAKQLEQEGDHRTRIFAGSEPADQPLPAGLNFGEGQPSCAIETACLELTKRPHHDISDVTLTPALIRELGM